MGIKLYMSEITAIKKLRSRKLTPQKNENRNRRIFQKSYWYTTYKNKEENEN